MTPNQETRRVVRFGSFEADFLTQELRKNGMRLRLPRQSFQILKMLLERPADLVTREELQKALWPSDTFVDFEHGLNSGVARLREVLGDSAESPQLVETLPRRGYRFLGTIIPPAQELQTQPPAPPAEILASVASAEPVEILAPITSVAPVEIVASDLSMPAAPAALADSTKPRAAAAPSLFRSPFTWLLLAVCCAAAITLAYVKSRSSPATEVSTPVPFTTFPGVETYPAFSPDGSQVAFAWDGDSGAGAKGFDLYIKVIGSEKILRLTQHPSEFLHPAWSPDGSQIAFLRGGANSGLYLIPALGGPERKLRSVRMPYEAFSAIAWSAIADSIAFPEVDDATGDVRLDLLSLKTLQSVRIPHQSACGHEGFPAFSPEQNQFAYVCVHNYGSFGLYRAESDGSHTRLVTTFTGWPFGIAWGAGASKIVLSQDHGSGAELYEVAVAAGSTRKLPLGQNDMWPSLSVQASRLSFASGSESVNIWRKDLTQLNSPPLKLISSTREQTNPQYSPDGTHIAFESVRNGDREVWVSDADASNLMQISHFNFPNTGTPHWSPDSKVIAFDSRYTGKAQIYTVNLSDSLPHLLTTNVVEPSTPTWSHDGKWIYFVSGAADGQKLYRAPAAGGDAQPLSNSKAFGPLESPDGSFVVFAGDLDSAELKRVFLDHPGIESIFPGLPKVKDADLWTMDSRGIYFVPADSPLSISFYDFYDFATKRVRLLTKVDKPLRSYIGGLSVSSDRRWLLFSQIDDTTGDILLVEHFR